MNASVSQTFHEVANHFGFTWWLFSVQLVLGLALPTYASVLCLRYHHTNRRVLLWLLLVWAVPVVGPIVALAVLRRHGSSASASLPASVA